MPSVRLKALLVKIESTYKTDSAPTPAADAVQVENNFWNSIEYDFLEPNLREEAASAGMGMSGLSAPSGRYGHITVTVALKGTDAAFVDPTTLELSALLRICGLSETIVETGGTETITYQPISTSFESGTVWAYSAGALFKLVGCHAIITSMNLNAGQIGTITFDIWGVMVADPTDVGIPGTLAYAQKDVRPPNIHTAGLTLNAFDPDDFSSFVFEQRTQLATKPRGNDVDGHAGYEIININPHVTVTMDKPALASFNPWELWQVGTAFSWDIGFWGGAVAYNRIKLSGSNGRIMGAPHSDEDGLAMMDIEFRCQNTDAETADDSFTLLFSF